MKLTQDIIDRLAESGLECFLAPGGSLPEDTSFEPPSSVKWMEAHYKLSIGAFSYAVRGFYFNVSIGRYTSIGEAVQVGRGDHPTSWVSTSPAFYINNLFRVGHNFPKADLYHKYAPMLPRGEAATHHKETKIGSDVYIGHGAFIRPGVTIGHGAIVAANSVVVKDVPPYAVVAGNAASIKKYRISEHLIERMLAVEWWRFAPWHLEGIDMTKPERALDILERLCPKIEPYHPGYISIQHFSDQDAKY